MSGSVPHTEFASLREHLLEHSVKTGDFTLKSGRKSSWFIDSKQTVCRPEAMVLVADAVVDRGAWPEPMVFGEIRRLGDVDEQEMARVFNLGVGMVLVADAAHAADMVGALGAAGRDAVVIGVVTEGAGRVQLTGTALRP